MGFWQTWRNVMFEPMEFYEKMPKKIGFKEPILFHLKVHALVLAIFYVMLIIIGLIIASIAGLVVGSHPVINWIMGIGLLIVIPIAILLYPLLLAFGLGMLFVGSVIIHLFVTLFGGKKEYAETFKAMAYSSAPLVFSFIPIVNYAATFYSIALQVIGIHKRQKLSIGKSVGIVLIPVAIFGIIYGMFIFILMVIGNLG